MTEPVRPPFDPMVWVRRLDHAYVPVIAFLALLAMRNPNHISSMPFALAIVFTLPMFIPSLPALYVGGALIWHITGADHGGVAWPVTVVYVVLFVGAAVANRWFAHLVWRRLQVRRLNRP